MTQCQYDTKTSLYDTPFIAMLKAHRHCVLLRLCLIEPVSYRDCVISRLCHYDLFPAFVNIVLDRRGNRVPKLVCCSEDTVVTQDTGTGEVNFYIRERKNHCYNIGDDLARCAKQWPQTDREGTCI